MRRLIFIRTKTLQLLGPVACCVMMFGCGGSSMRAGGTPKVIYLARHGQTEWNRISRFQGDPDLDAVGYLNRVSLWKLLKDKPLASIYTSAMKRTQRTAELVARQHKLKIQARAELNEIQPGIFEGLCYGQVVPEILTKRPRAAQCMVPARGSRPEVIVPELRRIAAGMRTGGLDFRLPLGESYLDMNERIGRFVQQQLRSGAADSAVLIIGHGVTNRILLHQLLGWSLHRVRRLRQENDQVYRIEGAGTDSARIFLFTPGVGWKRCSAPKPGQHRLDCNPGPPEPAAASQPAG